MTAVMTGMRRGEILAMKWENLGWDKKTYSISESYSAYGVDSPKTESSSRSVHVPPSLLSALKEHKAGQNEHRLRTGSRYQDNGLVFATSTGSYIKPTNLRSRIFLPALRKAGLQDSLRFHDLRGTCITLLLESGADLKTVQDQVGHKTARMTLEVYAKSIPEHRRTAVHKLDDYVFGQQVVQTRRDKTFRSP